MDWIKVKVKHAEYDFVGAPDNVFRAWIMVMILTAAIEKMPTPKQIESRIGKDNYQSLSKHLKDNNNDINNILSKVMEDVDHINTRRKHESEYMSKYRSKVLHKDLQPVLVSCKEKIREEKNNTVPKGTNEKPKSIPKKRFSDGFKLPDPKEQAAVAEAIARDKGKLFKTNAISGESTNRGVR